MLVGGVFTTPNSKYSFYEVKEPGFYRIDFTEFNAEFQVDFQKVKYSLVRKKNVFTLGDSTIYDEYLRIRGQIESANMKSTKSSNWNDGEFITQIHAQNPKLGYSIDSVKVNNNLREMTLIGEGYQIIWIVIDPIYGIKLDPLNFNQYQTLSVSKDTVSETGEGGVFYTLDVLRRRFDLRHIEEKDFVVATDLKTARERLRQFDKSDFPFRGFDTETTGVDICMYGSDKMVGIVLGTDYNTSTYFPFRHKGDFNLPMEFLDELMKVVIKHQEHLVAHNKKFDRQVMMFEGYDLRIKWDTLQLSIVLNPTIGKGTHALKTLIYELNQKRFLELTDIFINSKDIDFSVLPVDIIKYYACADATNVLELLADQLKKLPKYHYRLAFLECDLADVKADQEYYGIRVDVKKFERHYRNCNYVLEMLLDAFRVLTKEDRNINSKQVLSDLLYNKMRCPVLLRTNTGQPSTSKAAIKKLANKRAAEPKPFTEDLVDLDGNVIVKAKDLAQSAYPALVLLAKYSEYNKLKTAFYARFERTMKTGRVFFWVNQNGAATGRQSSPMHQLPAALKEVILSDAEDRDFWGPDFSQIELRMIAYLAGEQDLIDLAMDPDNDIHRVIGSLISGKEMWAITPEERSTGKRRNFGVVYLISALGLAGQIFGPGYSKDDVKFCEGQLNEFYHKFKRIDRYIKQNGKKVQERGYMETKWYHRRRVFDEIFDPNLEPRRRASIIRMANNVPVQGTAADYLKLAECQMYEYIRKKGWNELKGGFPRVRMMLSIHDEIILSADQSIPYEEIIEMITKCMETPVEGAPPFFVQPARMDNWEGHSDDACAMPIRYRDQVIEDYNRTGVSVFKQSYFRLSLPEDVIADINSSSAKVNDLIDKHLDSCTLVFDHGDYTKGFTKEHVKDALKNYILSRFTLYRIDNYIDKLNDFRHLQLDTYMNELIQEYGTDYKIVGQHVRHPSLTHQLLDVYKKRIPYDETHENRITLAAKEYIEDLLSNKKEEAVTFVANLDIETAKPTDKDQYTESLELLVNFDADGNVVFADNEEVDDVLDMFSDDDPDDIISRASADPVYVWELADIIVYDVQNLHQRKIDEVLKYIYKTKQDNGFYSVKLLYNNQLLDTKMRVEHPDIEEANRLLISLQEELVCG